MNTPISEPRSPALTQLATTFVTIACICACLAVWCIFNGEWRAMIECLLSTLVFSAAYVAFHSLDRIEQRQEAIEHWLAAEKKP
ncbi:MAG: hypothetical protein NTV21_14540 [Planctomycetota bacterium]|nr:hypothetical protein [Planctomycetota bacterium]